MQVSLRYRPRWRVSLSVFRTATWLSVTAVFMLNIVFGLVLGRQATVNEAVRWNG